MFDRRWAALAAVPPVVLAGWVITGQRGPERLELPYSHVVDTSTVMALTALALSAALLWCAVDRSWGLAALGSVMMAIAAFWPIVQHNQFSGPILVDLFGTHGIHRNDVLAVVPGTLGIAAFVAAERRRRAGRRSRRDDEHPSPSSHASA
jgi:hypothetical protein